LQAATLPISADMAANAITDFANNTTLSPRKPFSPCFFLALTLTVNRDQGARAMLAHCGVETRSERARNGVSLGRFAPVI
jgi:hypothetical protein